MIEIIFLQKENDFLNLYFKNNLSTDFKDLIAAKINYLFYYQNHVYGFYSLAYTKNKIFYLNKSDHREICFQPSKISLTKNQFTPTDKKKILHIFNKENMPIISLYLQITQKTNEYKIHLLSKNIDSLFAEYTVSIDVPLKELLSQANEIVSSTMQNKSIVQAVGKKLYQKIIKPQKELTALLKEQISITISNKASLPIELFADDSRFPFIENTVVYHKNFASLNFSKIRFPLSTRSSASVDQKFSVNYQDHHLQKSFLLISSDENQNLQAETSTIQKIFSTNLKQQKITTQIINLNEKMHFSEIKNTLPNHDLWHISCHGKQINNTINFLYKNKVIFNFRQLQKINNVPQFLFLNVCEGDHRQFRKWFFASGGKTLIIARGKIETKHLVPSIKSFYWQLRMGKRIQAAFSSFQKQQFYFNGNAFRFRLYGDGNSKII